MDLLILGGTAFLGHATARAALARGHDVTCLARGTAPAPDGVTLVTADRDLDDGLAAVADHRWDAVVDVARQPGMVRRAVRDLTTDHWVYVSSANVYARFDAPEQDESAALLDPLESDTMADMTQYGPAKVACERHVRSASGPAAVVRAGLIAGSGDWSGRSGYYPWRFAHPTGDDVLVPGDLDFPTAMIDVEDLAAWLVHAAEERLDGPFNATGPTTTVRGVLDAAQRVATSATGATPPPARPVPLDALTEAGGQAWMGPMSLPLWVDDPDWRWFATLDTTAARTHGLATRPLEQTLAAALAFEEQRDAVAAPRSAGVTDDEERSLRATLDRRA